MRIGAKARTAKACVAAVMLIATPVNAWASAANTFYERSFVLAADRKCQLFAPPVRAALTAAERQARGAALRGGASEADLKAAAERARSRAVSVRCDNPDLHVVKGRVVNAFAGWARTPRMTFPGDRLDWTANRIVRDEAAWTLNQTSITGASPVAVGYASDAPGEAMTAVVSFVGKPRPFAVRVVMRDPDRAPRPWTDGALPPEAMRKAVWSSGVAPATASLLTEGRTQGEAWTFSPELARALDRLDPRERFAVEFVFRDDSVARAVFEVGDFSAGRAFVDMGLL